MQTKALTLRQAALKLNVHHATLRRWIHLGEGPKTFIKPGRRAIYRINPSDLDLFIERLSRGGK